MTDIHRPSRHMHVVAVTKGMALLKVHLVRTLADHPQKDGLVERFNQTLKGILFFFPVAKPQK